MGDDNRNGGGNDATVSFDADIVATPDDAIAFEPAPSLDLEPAGSTADPAAAKRTLKDEAGKLGRQATDRARGLVDQGKDRATGALDEFSRMIEDAAGTVDEKLGAQYGEYARSAAQSVAGFSDQIRDKQVDELLNDVRGFVRASPAIAIGTAAALGFLIARVVKAGADSVADLGDPRDPTKSA